jgi:hypothetical protein
VTQGGIAAKAVEHLTELLAKQLHRYQVRRHTAEEPSELPIDQDTMKVDALRG